MHWSIHGFTLRYTLTIPHKFTGFWRDDEAWHQQTRSHREDKESQYPPLCSVLLLIVFNSDRLLILASITSAGLSISNQYHSINAARRAAWVMSLTCDKKFSSPLCRCQKNTGQIHDKSLISTESREHDSGGGLVGGGSVQHLEDI